MVDYYFVSNNKAPDKWWLVKGEMYHAEPVLWLRTVRAIQIRNYQTYGEIMERCNDTTYILLGLHEFDPSWSIEEAMVIAQETDGLHFNGLAFDYRNALFKADEYTRLRGLVSDI